MPPMDADRAERLLQGPLAIAMVLPWLCYRPLVRLRNLGYDWGLLRTRRLPVPVCSVGNLAVGGTGKTPLVELVCRRLEALGWRPAVLSRGYKGDPDGNDEARMLRHPVVCDPQRLRGGRRAIREGATALVLDDGFQHRRLARDLDLVCIDATRPWGRSDARRGRTLPLGLLREAPSALARADAVVLTRCDQAAPALVARLHQRLAAAGLPVLHCRHRPVAVSDLAGEPVGTPADLAGRRVHAACGIGHPAAFARSLEDLGAEVVRLHRFGDHHRFDRAEVAAVLEAAGTGPVLITAKDAVKWADLVSGSARARVRVLTVAAELEAADDARLTALLRGVVGSPLEPDGNAC